MKKSDVREEIDLTSVHSDDQIEFYSDMVIMTSIQDKNISYE